MKEYNITSLDIVISFSEAFDLIDQSVKNHHYDVAYLVYEIAIRLGIKKEKLRDVVIAALMHDIGSFKVSERIALMKFEFEKPQIHAINGYYLLKSYKPFSKLANYVRYHHLDWEKFSVKNETALLSNIIYFADRISILFNKNNYYLNELDKIEIILKKQNNKKFNKQLFDIFLDIKNEINIWNNFQFGDKENILKENLKNNSKILNIDEILQLGRMYAQIIDFRNRFTALHSTGVASIAEKLSKLLNLNENEQKKLKLAGYFHDLGKLAISNKILNKNTKLSIEEFQKIQKHPYHTYRIISKIDSLKEIAQIASRHHEKLDGSGYPFGLTEQSLDYNSRILAVADIFTALTEDRPYRKMFSQEKVISILTQMVDKRHLDSDIVKITTDNFEILQKTNLLNQKKIDNELNSMNNFLIVN